MSVPSLSRQLSKRALMGTKYVTRAADWRRKLESRGVLAWYCSGKCPVLSNDASSARCSQELPVKPTLTP